jgi:hypothetical protein
MKGGNAHPARQQQQGNDQVAVEDAQNAEQSSGDGRSQNNKVAQAHAVGQVADERIKQAGQLGKNRQAAGKGIVGGQPLLQQRQQRGDEGTVGVVHKVAARDGEDLVGVEGVGNGRFRQRHVF